jgi:hypothetical protein
MHCARYACGDHLKRLDGLWEKGVVSIYAPALLSTDLGHYRIAALVSVFFLFSFVVRCKWMSLFEFELGAANGHIRRRTYSRHAMDFSHFPPL